MSDRDELARDIARHFDHIFGKPETKPLRHDYLLADAILAAGWVKGNREYRVWFGIESEDEPSDGWFYVSSLNVERYRSKNPDALIQSRLHGNTEWVEA